MTFLAKWSYDQVYRNSKPRWDSNQVPIEVEAMVDIIPSEGRVLDLGCGTGTNAIYLAKNGFDVTAIDFSKEAIKMAQAKAKKSKVSVNFQEGDVTKLDFLDDSFDFVLDLGCLHGLSQSGRKAYGEHVTRLAKPGSRLMIWAFNEKKLWVGAAPFEFQRLFEPDFSLEHIEVGQFHDRPSSWYWFLRS